MKKLILFSLVILAALPLASCGPVKKDKLQVYASFYVVYDFASKIAGEHADVYCVSPMGASSHDWEPTPKDMARIEQADILFYSGLGMEQWVDKVSSSVKNTPFVMLSDGLGDGSLDPHVWLDPNYAREQIKRITEALIEADAARETEYRNNYEAIEAKITELDSSYKNAGLAGKTIITDHAAYGYMCKAYGITQISVDALDSGPDVSASRIAEIIEYMKENNINYIFCGKYSNQKIIDIIAKESGAEKLYLSPCEWISDEQLQNNEDYFSIMYENLESLKKGAQ